MRRKKGLRKPIFLRGGPDARLQRLDVHDDFRQFGHGGWPDSCRLQAVSPASQHAQKSRSAGRAHPRPRTFRCTVRVSYRF